jgi:hypothetical protein
MAESDSEVEFNVPPSTVFSFSPPPASETSGAGPSRRRPRNRASARRVNSVSAEAPPPSIGGKSLFPRKITFLTDSRSFSYLATLAAPGPLPEAPMISLGELVKSLTPTSVSGTLSFLIYF